MPVLFFLLTCKKSTSENAAETLPTGTTLAAGAFTSNVHPTSGTVKMIQDANNKKYLVFENFRTDNGIDLRVWISPNTTGSPYQDIGVLKAVSGKFSYELSAAINYTTNNRILIWCVPVSILFGHAVLQ